MLHSARELIRKRPGMQVVKMEEWAKRLETTGDYKVLRRLVARTPTRSVVADRIGITLDLETTGLDTNRDEVVEVAMVKFGHSFSDTHINDAIVDGIAAGPKLFVLDPYALKALQNDPRIGKARSALIGYSDRSLKTTFGG